MAEKIGSIWAIDIGNTSLKALRLSNESGTLEVIGFDHILHGKILSGTGVKEQEKQELIALSLRQFVEQNDIGRDEIIVAVPSQNSFARFVNLPPVEEKRIPEIVKFEASQQIPFEISEVTWDWQMMTQEGSAEAKVGIFAIKNDVVTAELEHFSRENLEVSYVQISPMALYNYLVYDRPELVKSDTQATVVLNIGAENTDLVVCTKSDVWQRTIPMGGNAFTKAIAETFKLNFEKAEKLKRTAPMSKYARQILQAMKPVFADLAAEIQRSLGFYSSSHPNAKLARIVALGGGTKMRGLLQYLQQSLQMPIERPDAFKRLGINTAVSAAKFHESVADFGIVYGLAVQGLGIGAIESNLLPRSMARSMIWASKTKYFVGAACLIMVASALAFARVLIDQASYQSKSVVRDKTKQVVDAARKAQSDLQAQRSRSSVFEAAVKKEFDLFRYRDILPIVHRAILESLPGKNTNRIQSQLYEAFSAGDIAKVKETPRAERKQIFITGMSVYYTANLPNATFGTVNLKSIGAATEEGPEASSEDDRAYLEQMYGRGGGQFKPTPAAAGGQKPADKLKSTAERGFVITIAGYSPYKDIGEILDPAGAIDDVNKWGFVTQLAHLDTLKIFDGNSPLELYNKQDKKNFEIKTGEVDIVGQMPTGIGVRKTSEGGGADVLVDPMTREVISKVAVGDSSGKKQANTAYQVNDHWFVMNLKLKWKDAPERAVGKDTKAAPGRATAVKAKTEEPKPAQKSKTSEPSGGRKGKDTGFGGEL